MWLLRAKVVKPKSDSVFTSPRSLANGRVGEEFLSDLLGQLRFSPIWSA